MKITAWYLFFSFVTLTAVWPLYASTTPCMNAPKTLRSLCDIRASKAQINSQPNTYRFEAEGHLVYVDYEYEIFALTQNDCSLVGTLSKPMIASKRIRQGDYVRATGCLEATSLHPGLTHVEFDALSKRPLPSPQPADTDNLGAIRLDAQWLALSVQPTEAAMTTSRSYLSARTGDTPFRIVLLGQYGEATILPLLQGFDVKAHGIQSYWFSKTVPAAEGPAFSIPGIDHVFASVAQVKREFVSRLLGTVILRKTPNVAYIFEESENRVVEVRTTFADLLEPGQRIRVNAYEEIVEGSIQNDLLDMTLGSRSPGAGIYPRAEVLTGTDLSALTQPRFGRVQATVRRVLPENNLYPPDGRLLHIQVDDVMAMALIRWSANSGTLASARTIELTGIVAPPGQASDVPFITIHSPRFLNVLEHRTYWGSATLENALRILFIALLATMVIASVAMALAYIRKRHSARLEGLVKERTQELRLANYEKLTATTALNEMRRKGMVATIAEGIVHDFSNILSIIRVSADLLTVSGPQSSRELSQSIIDATDRATAIMSQLRTLGHAKPTDVMMVELWQIINSYAALFQTFLPSYIQLDLAKDATTTPTYGRVRCSKSGVEQIVLNLLINARDALEPAANGRITLQLKQESGDAGICASCEQSIVGSYQVLICEDNGPGVPDDLVPRIFKRFFTTKEAQGGTGIGLNTVSSLIHEADGHVIYYRSSLGGAGFKVFFPAHGHHDLPTTSC